MSTKTAPAPTPVTAPAAEPTAPEPAPQRLAFKRIVVFESLRDAVGCTAGA